MIKNIILFIIFFFINSFVYASGFDLNFNNLTPSLRIKNSFIDINVSTKNQELIKNNKNQNIINNIDQKDKLNLSTENKNQSKNSNNNENNNHLNNDYFSETIKKNEINNQQTHIQKIDDFKQTNNKTKNKNNTDNNSKYNEYIFKDHQEIGKKNLIKNIKNSKLNSFYSF